MEPKSSGLGQGFPAQPQAGLSIFLHLSLPFVKWKKIAHLFFPPLHITGILSNEDLELSLIIQ